MAFGVHFGCIGLPLGLLGRHLGVIWGVLGCCGGPFWESGSAPGCLRRAVVAKDPLALSAPPRIYRFWRPKGVPKAPKMELKSVKYRFKNWLTFLFDLSLVSEAFFDD